MNELMESEEGRAEGIGASAGALEKTVEFDIDKDEDTALVASDTPSKHDPDALDAHASVGHDLIAIDGKKPVASGWRRIAPHSLDDAKARMARRGNVGVRLRDIDLVVDVDPRHSSQAMIPWRVSRRISVCPRRPSSGRAAAACTSTCASLAIWRCGASSISSRGSSSSRTAPRLWR